MHKLAEYIIVRGDEAYTDRFIEEVNQKIFEGYQPLGGLAVRTGACQGAHLLQAMVMKER